MTFLPRPFTIAISDDELNGLHSRLDKARWPLQDVVPQVEGEAKRGAFGLGYGIELKDMKELAEGWKKYDWREQEKWLNSFDNFTVEVEEYDIHYVHTRSSRPDATPLILCHGWPGSFAEFLHTIPLLAEPEDLSQPAFHVVVPSMPGFTFSSPPKNDKWQMPDTARLFNTLMVGLGYESYVAQGGDWGSITARCLGSLFKENCKAVHLNFCPVPPPAPLSWLPPRTLLSWMPRFVIDDKKRKQIERGLDYVEKGSAYSVMQSLTPRTPAYALNDSPIGLLAWIGEKIIPSIEKAAAKPDPTLNRDALFLTLSLYWFTGSVGTSFLPYTLNPYFTTFLTDPKYFIPRLAVSAFPGELLVPNERDSARTGTLKHFQESESGGHFAAWEEPRIFVQHVQKAVPVLLKD